MKTKILILAAMLAAAFGAQAQYGDYYYHHTGDTVYNKSEIGFYNWWEWDQLIQDRDVFKPYVLGAWPIMMTKYFTATPISIVGIAGCPTSITTPGYQFDSTLKQEYFYLFDAEGEDIIYMDRLAWNLGDAHRTLVLPYNGVVGPGSNIDSCCGNFFGTQAFDLYEYYFDTPITITDSFYVGWSGANRSSGSHTSIRYHTMGAEFSNGHACDENDLGFGVLPVDENGNVIAYSNCGAIPLFTYYYCTDTAINTNPQEDYIWSTLLYRDFVLVYPLIQIDTTLPPSFMCDPVQNFSATVLDTGSGCVFFTWDDFYHYTYCEVQYYAFEQGYSSAVTTTVSGNNLLHLCGLDTTLTYFARIRAYCDTSKVETEWSGWTSFSFPHSAPPQGITSEPTILDRFTHLMPNPAADMVTVTSELGLRRIEVYNARGILVYSEPANYSSKAIDLRGWPAGQYMMSIETPQGKTAKRLVVAR